MMNAEVIAIGDELTNGERLDTNSRWISQRLAELGISVSFHTTVGDNLENNAEVFRRAVQRVDVVVVTGGLGPTADDLTRDAIAEATGTELVLDSDALEHIVSLFKRRGREMAPSNRNQAMFPYGACPIPNPHGTAPGIATDVAREGREPCRLYALPGVPVEMRQMWADTVAKVLTTLGGPRSLIRHREIKCFGVGESQLEEMLPDLIRRGRVPSVGITVHGGTITLRITAEGPTAQECDTLMEPTAETIFEALGDLVFGEGDEELEHVVVRQLVACGATLAVAESGTMGWIASWLGEVPEARDVYLGGKVIPYGRQQDANAFDHAAIEQMATNVREEFATDFGLAIGPLPYPHPGESTNPIERFYFALATEAGTEVHQGRLPLHPAIMKDIAAKQALNCLRLTLLGE